MREGFYRSEYIPPEEKNLHQFKGASLMEVIEYLEGKEEEQNTEDNNQESSIFDGFLDLLRSKGVRVSTPEWLQFLQVIGKKTKAKQLKELVNTNELFNKVRLFAQTTLVKNKADEAAFHDAFNEYFELAAKIYSRELQKEEEKDSESFEEKDPIDSEVEPDIKDQLNIEEVVENLDLPEDQEHDDNENVHGGKKDQHNDVLKKADLSKQGGGDKKAGTDKEASGTDKEASEKETENQKNNSSKLSEESKNEQQKMVENGNLVGGGKGKSVYAERVRQDSIINEGEKINKEIIQEREKSAGRADRRMRYEVRPDRASMGEVIRNIRRVILDVSEVKTKDVNLSGTVKNFARRDFRFDYQREREKQPEIVLLVDVGGPVDEWSPLVKEVAEAMVKGLTKLEIYLFHNNLYGYVWKPDSKNLSASNYAKENSLIDLKSIVKKRKKVIIYGDAEMSYSELEGDYWPPRGNDERVEKFGMGGEECLNFINKKSDSAVWINPIFKKEWQYRDDSETIKTISQIIHMHDLTVGGVEDAIKDLMKK